MQGAATSVTPALTSVTAALTSVQGGLTSARAPRTALQAIFIIVQGVLPPQSWNECEVTEDGVTYTAFHKQVDLGEVDLSPSEEAEIRGELAQVAQLIKEGKVRTSKNVS